MCGIAGYSINPNSRVDRTLAAQALLAGIAERGADAVGYAWRGRDAPVVVHKERTGASSLLDRMTVPRAATEVLLHVRAYTKGHPAVASNNHPIRHRAVVGIHNGTIENDDAVLARLGHSREAPDMTVDSEAIFALADAHRSNANALEQLEGSMATAWLDEREADVLHIARGSARPLWLGQAASAVFFASTPHALEVLSRTLALPLRFSRLREGTAVAVASGVPTRWQRFAPRPSSAAKPIVAPVAAPQEGRRCLRRLSVLAARRPVDCDGRPSG
jgi:glucosamine 6-phosphate synthetase-like amidotransferase/phosphosugar isomerase protein